MRILVITCDTCDNITDHLVKEIYKLINNNLNIADNGEIRIACLDSSTIQDIVTKHVAISTKLSNLNNAGNIISFTNEKDKALVHAMDYLEGICGNVTYKNFIENLFRYVSRSITDQLDETSSKRLINAMSIITDNIKSGNTRLLTARKFDVNIRTYISRIYGMLETCKK